MAFSDTGDETHGRSVLRYVAVWVLSALLASCASLEVVKIGEVPVDKEASDPEGMYLHLTRPAWEVEFKPQAAESEPMRVTFRAVNVWDAQHIYHVRLTSGLFGWDRLSITGPAGPAVMDSCVDGEARASAEERVGSDLSAANPGTVAAKEVVCAEAVPPGVGFPAEEDILYRFHRTGRRVFIYMRPEATLLPSP